MKVLQLKNKTFTGAEGKKSLIDLEIPKNWNRRLVIFIHGYKGYKDWGCWNLVQEYFVSQGNAFVKYNVSHNGGTLDNPIDFDDLEAFAKNSYSKEIADFEAVLAECNKIFKGSAEVCVIGHSRGGGIALLQSLHPGVDKICSWAGISSIENRFPSDELLDKWKKEGVYYVKNGRTKQEMPHNYSQYEDFLKHKDRLNIKQYCLESKKPTCLIHGDNDASVHISEGMQLSEWLKTPLITIEGTQHTFDSSHPWEAHTLPPALHEACRITHEFFDNSKKDDSEETLSIMSDLVKLAKSDEQLQDAEFQFLYALASQLGVSKEEFKIIFEQNIKFNPPKLEADRILQLQRLILLMNVDAKTSEAELDYIRDIGIRMGLHPGATNEVLRVMNEYDMKLVPAERLMNIFRTFHN